MAEINEAPKGDYTLIVPLNREKSKTATFYIKDMREDTLMAARVMIDKGKDFDAVRLIIKDLWVGGDDPVLLKDNLIAVSSAAKLVLQLVEPIEGELKKN